MEPQAFVPTAIREYVQAMVNGNSWEPFGWAGALKNAQDEVSKVDRQIKSASKLGASRQLDDLRQKKQSAEAHRDALSRAVSCLTRFVEDRRMVEAYRLLVTEIADDQEWKQFITAAWQAQRGFHNYREQLSTATTLKVEIADSAEALANLLNRFAKIGINVPSEFCSIPELLRQTDNHELQGHNLDMWRSMRRYILGELPRQERSTGPLAEVVANEALKVKIRVLAKNDVAQTPPEEDARFMAAYAWATAPDFSALLGTLASAARKFEPQLDEMSGAALTRQSHGTNEYLRAFGHLLTAVYRFKLSKSVVQAMAIVAEVVINSPDVLVSLGDVKSALGRKGETLTEGSHKKQRVKSAERRKLKS